MALGSLSWSLRNEPSSVVGMLLRCASSWTVVSTRVLFAWFLGTGHLLSCTRRDTGADLVHCHVRVMQLHVVPLPEAAPLVDGGEHEVHRCSRLGELRLAPLTCHLDEEVPIWSAFAANPDDEVGDVVLLLAGVGIGDPEPSPVGADPVVLHPGCDLRE